MRVPLPVTNEGHHTTVFLYRQPELKIPRKQGSFLINASSQTTQRLKIREAQMMKNEDKKRKFSPPNCVYPDQLPPRISKLQGREWKQKYWPGRTLWNNLFPVLSSATGAATQERLNRHNLPRLWVDITEYVADIRTLLLQATVHPGAHCKETWPPHWTCGSNGNLHRSGTPL